MSGDSLQPHAQRPHMPGYGISLVDSGLLPWSWAVERLAATHNYWVATTKGDGSPHVMAVWGVWLDDGLYFSTGVKSLKARNVARDARCVVTTENADEAVIVEGVAEPVTDRVALARFKAVYDPKYSWDMDVSSGEGFYAVRPHTVFGFIEHADQFGSSATRWTFRD